MPLRMPLTHQQSQREPLNGMLYMRSTPKSWLQQRCLFFICPLINPCVQLACRYLRSSTNIGECQKPADPDWQVNAVMSCLYRIWTSSCMVTPSLSHCWVSKWDNHLLIGQILLKCGPNMGAARAWFWPYQVRECFRRSCWCLPRWLH